MIYINALDFIEQQLFTYEDLGFREPSLLSTEAIQINKNWTMVKSRPHKPDRVSTIKNVTNEIDSLPDGTYEGVLVKFEVTKKGKRQSKKEEFILMYWEDENE